LVIGAGCCGAAAARFSLNRLVLIVDRNGLQSYGSGEQVLRMGGLARKFDAFGCNAIDVDGHDCDMLEGANTSSAISPCGAARADSGEAAACEPRRLG